jgi:hypothetical protein
MIARALAVLSAAVFFYAALLLKIPWPVSVFVLLPLYILVVAGLLTRHDTRARRIWKSDPEAFDRDPVPELRAATELLQNAGFRRVGDFVQPALTEIAVRALRHPDDAMIACIRRREKELSFEFITFLDDGGDLTTTTDTSAQWEPRPFQRRLLIVRNADPILVLDEHRNGVHYLKQMGKNPVPVSDSRFAAAAAGRELDLTRFIQSSGTFWPLRHLWWNLSRPDRGYEIPIDGRGSGPRRPSVSGVESPASRPAGAGAVPASTPGSAAQYRVVFRGAVREGFTVRQVKDNLAAAFKLDASKTDTLFSGPPVLIKSGVDEASARKYADAFWRAGARVDVELLPAAPVKAGPDRPLASAAAPSAAPKTGAATVAPSFRTGGPDSPVSAEDDREIMRFKIHSLLASERTEFEKTRKDKPVGWLGYALAISSFLPYVGLAGGTVASIYGWMRRKNGGWRIIILAAAGSLISSLGSFSGEFRAIPGFEHQGRVLRVQETEKRLNVLVRSLESYRARNGEYPESLDRLAEATEEKIETKDPMSGGRSKLYYEPDPSGESYLLFSPGPDGLAGTEDDVTPTLMDEEMSETGWRPLE